MFRVLREIRSSEEHVDERKKKTHLLHACANTVISYVDVKKWKLLLIQTTTHLYQGLVTTGFN